MGLMDQRCRFIETKKGNIGQDGPVFNYKFTSGRNSPNFKVNDGFQNRDLFHSLLSDGAINDNYFSMSGGNYVFRHFVSYFQKARGRNGNLER